MGSFPKDELARRPSLVALLFRLEQQNSREEFRQIEADVVDWFREHKGYERLRALFAELIREACARSGVILPGPGNLLEEKTMLEESIEAWGKQWFADGKAEGEATGKATGRAEGKVEGKAEALIALLVGRFGTVAPSWQEQIDAAELVTLERWFERAIVAPDVPSVFNPPR